jgi:hypothetical protein
MFRRFAPRSGSMLLALGVWGCSVYEPGLLEPEPTEGGSGGGGGAMSMGASGTVIPTGGTGAMSGSAGESASSGTGGTAGNGSQEPLPYVTGSARVPPIVVNLSNEGARDWAHWGLAKAEDYNHKAGVTSQLLDFKPIGAAAPAFKLGGPITFSWNDGMPTAQATTTNGVTWKGLDEGFELVTSAAYEERRVRLYVGITGGGAVLSATLSDPRASSPLEERISSPAGAWNLQLFSVEYGVAAEDTQLSITMQIVEAIDTTAAISLHGVTFDAP